MRCIIIAYRFHIHFATLANVNVFTLVCVGMEVIERSAVGNVTPAVFFIYFFITVVLCVSEE